MGEDRISDVMSDFYGPLNNFVSKKQKQDISCESSFKHSCWDTEIQKFKTYQKYKQIDTYLEPSFRSNSDGIYLLKIDVLIHIGWCPVGPVVPHVEKVPL